MIQSLARHALLTLVKIHGDSDAGNWCAHARTCASTHYYHTHRHACARAASTPCATLLIFFYHAGADCDFFLDTVYVCTHILDL